MKKGDCSRSKELCCYAYGLGLESRLREIMYLFYFIDPGLAAPSWDITNLYTTPLINYRIEIVLPCKILKTTTFVIVVSGIGFFSIV